MTDCSGRHSSSRRSIMPKAGFMAWNSPALTIAADFPATQILPGRSRRAKTGTRRSSSLTRMITAYVQNHWIYLDHDQRVTGSFGVAYTWNESARCSTRVYADALYGSGLRADGGGTEDAGGRSDSQRRERAAILLRQPRRGTELQAQPQPNVEGAARCRERHGQHLRTPQTAPASASTPRNMANGLASSAL